MDYENLCLRLMIEVDLLQLDQETTKKVKIRILHVLSNEIDKCIYQDRISQTKVDDQINLINKSKTENNEKSKRKDKSESI